MRVQLRSTDLSEVNTYEGQRVLLVRDDDPLCERVNPDVREPGCPWTPGER